ncbi:MAG TPA: hypothetical protein VGR73_00940 [Bryobacteraceae bacterium]|nr:hypothetical protein [Bryobacteraceae bacterium]
MATCSRCGVAETWLYINGLPVCLDCDKQTLQPLDSPLLVTGSNRQPHPPKKAQSVEDSTPAAPPIHRAKGC